MLNDFVFEVTLIEVPYGNWGWLVWNFFFQEPDIIFSWNTNSFHCYIPPFLFNWGNRTGYESLKIYRELFQEERVKKVVLHPWILLYFCDLNNFCKCASYGVFFSMMLYAFWECTDSKSFGRWHSYMQHQPLTSDLGYNVFRAAGVSLH